jgi:thioesterase domain-containing protein
MQLEVREATAERVVLKAPLAPNINHRETVFGGSASAVAILSAWTLLYVRLKQARRDARIVIQRNTMMYTRPIPGDFTAVCFAPDAEAWQRFLNILERKGRARLTLVALLECNAKNVGELEGDFVAITLPIGSSRR